MSDNSLSRAGAHTPQFVAMQHPMLRDRSGTPLVVVGELDGDRPVRALYVMSEARQARKQARLSGRQWKRARKRARRAAKALQSAEVVRSA